MAGYVIVSWEKHIRYSVHGLEVSSGDKSSTKRANLMITVFHVDLLMGTKPTGINFRDCQHAQTSNKLNETLTVYFNGYKYI
jgi:hypothetical protein